MVTKYVWLEWNGQGWTVNVETWETGRKPFNTLIRVASFEEGKGMVSSFIRLGYREGIN
jgi:hypothetical protein